VCRLVGDVDSHAARLSRVEERTDSLGGVVDRFEQTFTGIGTEWLLECAGDRPLDPRRVRVDPGLTRAGGIVIVSSVDHGVLPVITSV